MALFNYQALNKQGKKIKGTIDAVSPEFAREQLVKSGLYPIHITAIEQINGRGNFITRLFSRRISVNDKILFTKQLAILLKSGVPLLQALDLLSEQFSGYLKNIIIDVKDDIKQGGSLAQGLAKFPKVFDNIYIQLVRAGEASGRLEVILERLVDYLERRQEINKRVKGALRYPLIQLALVCLVVTFLLTFVLPSLTAQFSAQGAVLPFSTRLLIGLSHIITHYWYLLIIIIVVFYFAFRYWRSTPRGGTIVDTLKLKLPIIGFFSRMNAIVQFSRTLGMLLESGVNLAEALDIVVKITPNKILATALDQARDKIIKQGRISEFLKQSGVFPPIAIYLINTGEQSGQLDTMLLTVAKNYEDELIEYSDNLSALVDPIMMLVMGVVVGFIVLSIVQPMMQQAQLFKF